MKLTGNRVSDKFFLLSNSLQNYFGTGEDNLFPDYPVGQSTRFLSHRYKSSEIILWPQIYEVK